MNIIRQYYFLHTNSPGRCFIHGPFVLTIFLILLFTMSFLISGCSTGVDSTSEYVVDKSKNSIVSIGPFKRQSYSGQEKVEICPVKVYFEDGDNLTDISPGMVPQNAERVNNEIIYVSPFYYTLDEKKMKDTAPPPDWLMYQKLYKSDGSASYANLHGNDVSGDNFLSHYAYCPYGSGEDIPDDAVKYENVYSYVPVDLVNPGTTTVEYIFESDIPYVPSMNYTYKYSSFLDGETWYHEIWTYMNGEELWYSGVLPGKNKSLLLRVGRGSTASGIYTHRILRSVGGGAKDTVFERKYIQRKLAFQNKFEDIEFTFGEKIKFQNKMNWIWDVAVGPPNIIAVNQEETPRWVVEIYDPDGNLIKSSGELSGDELNWEWDTGEAGSGKSSVKPDGGKIKLVPLGSLSHRMANADIEAEETEEDEGKEEETDDIYEMEENNVEEYNEEYDNYDVIENVDNTTDKETKDDVVYTYKVTADARSYPASDTVPSIAGGVRYFVLSSKTATGIGSVNIRKIWIKGGVTLKNNKNKIIRNSKNNPQYKEDKNGNIKRNVPSAVMIKKGKNAYAMVTYYPSGIPVPSRYIIWGEVVLNDDASPPSPSDFKMIRG